jgi:hypothetical protein
VSAPAWVQRRVAEVCQRYGVAEPEVTWRRSKINSFSSGRAYNSEPRFVVTAGSDARDRRLVLHHELAHYVAKQLYGPDEAHSARFWAIAFDLYSEAKLLRYAARREVEYAGAQAEVRRRFARNK